MAQAVTAFIVAAALSVVAPAAAVADQTVLGRSFVVKDPAPGIDPSRRTIVVLGKEPGSPNTLVGDPQAHGATVQVIANGTTPTAQTFTLPAGLGGPGTPGWKALGNPLQGFSYRVADLFRPAD